MFKSAFLFNPALRMYWPQRETDIIFNLFLRRGRVRGGKVADGEISKDVFIAALREMNQVLKERGEHLTFLCVGGGAMMLVYGNRFETHDLDGVPEPQTQANASLLREVSEEAAVRLLKAHKAVLPNDWINTSVRHFLGGHAGYAHNFEPDSRYTWSNLKMLFAKPGYLLGMKCQAMRKGRKDFTDITTLLRILNIRTLDALLNEIGQYVDINSLGNDEFAKLKLCIASAFPNQTEYEPIRQSALEAYRKIKDSNKPTRG